MRRVMPPREWCAPPFGGPDAAWEDVSDFYEHWAGFSTRRTCAFADTFDWLPYIIFFRLPHSLFIIHKYENYF